MNEQALFDVALAHIRKQGKPSYDEGSHQCVYRHPDGLGCAFSPAIVKYSPEMEGTGASNILGFWPDAIKPEFREVDRIFADTLQQAHDETVEGIHFLRDFESAMKSLAAEYNLTYTRP